MMEMKSMLPLGLVFCQGLLAIEIGLASPWELSVVVDGKTQVVAVEPQALVEVTAEKVKLPVFDGKQAGWKRGLKPAGVRAQECTVRYAFVADSMQVTDLAGKKYVPGTDFSADPEWGTVGRLANGAIQDGQDVFLNYRYAPKRLDTLVRKADGSLAIRKGVPHVANPFAPECAAGESRIANIYMDGKTARLSKNNIFPILEQGYPEKKSTGPSIAEQMLPKFMAKLKAGQKVRIMAWGDSVTDASFLPDRETQAWFAVFFRQLREKFPNVQMELVREAWGGRNTNTYFAEPAGAIHNYQEKVLDAKADLYVSEFVNDAGLSKDNFRKNYERILKDFQAIGAEWIILTPHYVRPDWMGLDRERDIDDDPRPYVAMVRAFGAEKGIPVAEGSKRYGHLWREGIPYTILLLNGINHPNPFGQKLMGDAVFELFQ